ncbi:SpoIIAA family protein [Parachitinimonas caeni]|uniref:STAS/SEC14 domain-containing protein n=1 Tax=Parachitinimonas caeni TaxID=3031301 RepID=A0ABT7DW22_9NEIS|nr:STAS/SEC14 domain-containing protein [Parachitinimonas caeni]MDK2124243.1 STAS/SEC14 domain-containing protein [Parachitinimonas caeni]
MINLAHQPNYVAVTVAGEFNLADYKEFEENVLYQIKFHGPASLLFDLTEMLDYTLDVVWEEIRFSRAHRRDFGKIAVVTNDQWVTWSAWIARLFVDAEVQIFSDTTEAEIWLDSEAELASQQNPSS